MKITIQRRAEVALRSLSNVEQRQIERALTYLSALSRADLASDSKVRMRMRIVTSASGERLYIYRGTDRLRIVLSINGEVCNVEDIVDKQRLKRLLPVRVKQ